jgi:hypothetical protein
MKWKHNLLETMGYSKGSAKSIINSYEFQYQKTKKTQISINSLMLYVKLIEKHEQIKPQIRGWKK